MGNLVYIPPLKLSDLDQVARELQVISTLLQELQQGHVEEAHIPPTKPSPGMIRLADGTDWNPGLGAGIYAYYAGVWNKL